jgi:MYXO-CTERM domain-containing protein
MRHVAALVAGILIVAAPGYADAHVAGISGYSGETAGKICNNCHSGGPVPTVAFSGPTSLAAGATATYTFTVTTAQPLCGTDISATTGTTLAAGTGTQVLNGEITHVLGGVQAAGGKSTFTFQVTAPAAGVTQIELWGAGNATNMNGNPTGDRAAATTTMITVGTTALPDAGTVAGDDGGGGAMAMGGMASNGGTGAAGGGTDGGNGLQDPYGDNNGPLIQHSGVQCDVACVGRTSGFAFGGFGLVLLVGGVARRRRRDTLRA